MIATATFSTADVAYALLVGLGVGFVAGLVVAHVFGAGTAARRRAYDRRRLCSTQRAVYAEQARRLAELEVRHELTLCDVHEPGACPDGCPHAYAFGDRRHLGEDPPWSAAGGSYAAPAV